MLVSVVLDAYRQSDASDMLGAIRDLFVPDVYSGWASVGLYAYWQPDTHDLLYVGLSRDLGRRFAQHNGLMVCPPEGCKRLQIQGYFERHETLGFSVLTQSAFQQGIEDRFRDDVYDIMQHGEGQLIQSYRRVTGKLPPWNGMGGSKVGQRMEVDLESTLWEVAVNKRDSLLAARKTIRELSADPTAEWFEHNIHTARMYATEEALMGNPNASVLRWLERLRDQPELGGDQETYRRILAGDYLRQRALGRGRADSV